MSEHHEASLTKKSYSKPAIRSHGSVETITLKEFGGSDAILFQGDTGGGSAS